MFNKKNSSKMNESSIHSQIQANEKLQVQSFGNIPLKKQSKTSFRSKDRHASKHSSFNSFNSQGRLLVPQKEIKEEGAESDPSKRWSENQSNDEKNSPPNFWSPKDSENKESGNIDLKVDQIDLSSPNITRKNSQNVSEINIQRNSQRYSQLLVKKGLDLSVLTKEHPSIRLANIVKLKILPRIRVTRLFVGNKELSRKYDKAYKAYIQDNSESDPFLDRKKRNVNQLKCCNLFNRFLFKLHQTCTFKNGKESEQKQGAYAIIQRLREIVKEHDIKTDEKEADLFVLNPDGKFQVYRSLAFLVVFSYLSLVLPLKLAFEYDPVYWEEILTCPGNLLMLTDQVLSLNTGFYDRGIPVLKRKKIFNHFYRERKTIEFITLFAALAGLIAFCVNSSEAGFLKSGLHLINSLILVRISSFGDQFFIVYDFLQVNSRVVQFLTIIKLMLLLIFFGHLCSCAWYWVGTYEQARIGKSWFSNEMTLYDSSVYEQYVTAYYWSITTMATVGYGDIVAETESEKIFAVVVMLLSSGLFAYSLNTIGGILNHFEEETVEIRRRLAIINYYMKSKAIPKELQSKVRKYLQYALNESNSRKQEELALVDMLSLHLKKAILVEVNGSVMSSDSFLLNIFSEPVLIEMTLKMKERNYMPLEIIINQSDHTSKSMYFIHSGRFEVFLYGSMTKLAIKNEKMIVGEVGFCSEKRRSASVRSLDFVNAYEIAYQDFAEILQSSTKEDVESFFRIRDKITLNNDYSELKVQCFVCQKHGHVAASCKETHVILSKKKIHQSIMNNLQNERHLFLRYEKRHFNPLRSKKEVESSALLLIEQYLTGEELGSDANSTIKSFLKYNINDEIENMDEEKEVDSEYLSMSINTKANIENQRLMSQKTESIANFQRKKNKPRKTMTMTSKNSKKLDMIEHLSQQKNNLEAPSQEPESPVKLSKYVRNCTHKKKSNPFLQSRQDHSVSSLELGNNDKNPRSPKGSFVFLQDIKQKLKTVDRVRVCTKYFPNYNIGTIAGAIRNSMNSKAEEKNEQKNNSEALEQSSLSSSSKDSSKGENNSDDDSSRKSNKAKDMTAGLADISILQNYGSINGGIGGEISPINRSIVAIRRGNMLQRNRRQTIMNSFIDPKKIQSSGQPPDYVGSPLLQSKTMTRAPIKKITKADFKTFGPNFVHQPSGISELNRSRNQSPDISQTSVIKPSIDFVSLAPSEKSNKNSN